MSASEQESSNPLLRRAREALSKDPAWAGRSAQAPADPPRAAAEEGGRPPEAPQGQLARSVEDATAKIKEIIDAAEKVAADIDAEAHAEADRYLERRRQEADEDAAEISAELQNLTVPVLTRLQALRDDTDALHAAVEDAAAAIRGLTARTEVEEAPASEPASRPAPVAADDPPPFRGRGPVSYPGTGKGAEPTGGEDVTEEDSHAEAVLRATQMAVAGHDREEIEAALKSEYDIADAGALVEQLLGDAE